jgi:hypothetical protein
MATRDELVREVSERYGRASREERGRILDEFTAVTGLHRKHAVRLLRGGAPSRQSGSRPGRRVYDVAVREALIVVWEASAGDRAGWPSSRESVFPRVLTVLLNRKATRSAASTRVAARPGVVRGPSMHGRSLRGSREIFCLPSRGAHRWAASGRPDGRSR